MTRIGFVIIAAALSALAVESATAQPAPQLLGRDEGYVQAAVATEEQTAGGVDPHVVLMNYYGKGPTTIVPDKLPPDPWGHERLARPTPAEGFGYAGVSSVGLNQRPDSKTVGIRLDTTYRLVRAFELGVYLSEHQHVGGGGVTLLPYQSPCFIIGTRILANTISNNAMTADQAGFSLDLYGGTRYKTLYLKFGPIWDYQSTFQKTGLAFAAMDNFPLIGNLTVDSAFAFGVSSDQITLPRDPQFGLRARRVESADFDMQIRLGKFWCENFQAGATVNYYDWNYTPSEWGAGAFCNIYFGRCALGLDMTGGDERWRGFATFTVSWGAHPCKHPQDCNHIPVDTVAWVTRSIMRDPSIRLRDSFTGPLPPFP